MGLFSFKKAAQLAHPVLIPARPIDQATIVMAQNGGIMQRLKDGVRYMVTGATPNAWFGPLQPLQPIAPETKGRQFDYVPGYNINITPRAWEPISFADLRGLAESYDVLRLCIETRKDQAVRMKWRFKVRDNNGSRPDKQTAEAAKPRIDALTEKFQFPDQEHDWDEWYRMLLEDMLVCDAATIFPRKTLGGKIFGYELVDGCTILPRITADGRTPMPPDTAYQQILHGIMTSNFSRDELVYRPRNRRTNHVYGCSQVQQIIMTTNIALRRQISQLSEFTEGSVPEAIIGLPASWTSDQIREYQTYWDELLSGNIQERRRARFVPDGVNYHPTKEAVLKSDFDEWLVRIVCFAFSIPPTPFIRAMNRATAESQKETAQEEGLEPMMSWMKRLMDYLLWKYENIRDLEFAWEEEEEIDQKTLADILSEKLRNGTISLDEARAKDGLDPHPNGLGSKPLIYTSAGAVLLESIVSPAPPEPPTPGTNPPPGDGSEGQPSEDGGKARGEEEGDQAAGAQKIEKLSSTEVDQAAHEAATSPLNISSLPTEKQKAAGNYKKGHISFHGLDITIENPKGSIRSGISKDGKEWSSELYAHYGYIKGTRGNDKNHIDVFIGDNPDSGSVFVVNQIDPDTGEFDEHKVILGTNSEDEAKKTYLGNYESEWGGLGSIVTMTMKQFKSWLNSGDTKKEAVQPPVEELAKYSEDQPRDAQGRFGEGSGESKTHELSDRAARAKAAYVPATAEAQRTADANEQRLAETLKGERTADNAPFDVVKGSHLIEVKTIVSSDSNKITMRKECLARKMDAVTAAKGTAHTVVFDNKSNSIYYKAGVGSFRLGNMEKVSLTALKSKFK